MSAKLHRLWHEQKGCCWYCGGDTYLPGGGETKAAARARFGLEEGVKGSGKLLRRHHATIEHLKRKTDGGTLANANIVMACKGCNVRRGSATVADFKSLVEALVIAGQHWTVNHVR